MTVILRACLVMACLTSCGDKAGPPMDREAGWTCQVSRGAEFRDLSPEDTRPFIAFYNELKRASWNVPANAKLTTKAVADYRVLFTKPALKTKPGENANTYILVYLPQMVDVDGGGLFEVRPEGVKRLTDNIRAHLGGDAGVDHERANIP